MHAYKQKIQHNTYTQTYTYTVFLDRHPFACVEILNIYRDEHVLQQPPHIPPEVWQSELFYFRMHKSQKPIDGMDKVFGVHMLLHDDDVIPSEIGRPEGGIRLKIWQVMRCVAAC